MSGAQALLSEGVTPPRILVLYGSLRSRSYSKLLAYEAARVLDLLGCEVHVFDPEGLPMKDDRSEHHPRVQELRRLSQWSEGQFWCSPEQHGEWASGLWSVGRSVGRSVDRGLGLD